MAAITNALRPLIIVAMQHLTHMGDVIASQFGNCSRSLAQCELPKHVPLASCDRVARRTIPLFEFVGL